MARTDARLDGWTRLCLGSAAIWSLGLVVASVLVTSYSSSNGPGQTLVQVNGIKVIAILLIPFVGVVIVSLALLRRRRLRTPGVGVLVWVVVGLMASLVVLGALSIGPFIAPVALFLVVAIARVKGPSDFQERAIR
jgi:hypothetical protein